MNNLPWMFCHPFHLSYRCMIDKVWQASGMINTLRYIHPSHRDPSYRNRVGKNCKTTIPSSGWCMLWHEEPQAIDVLPPIPHILWMCEQGLTKSGTQSINQANFHPSHRATNLSGQFWQEVHNHHAICRVVYFVILRSKGCGCVATHCIHIVGALSGFDKPGTQSIHWDVVHPKHRADKLQNRFWENCMNIMLSLI